MRDLQGLRSCALTGVVILGALSLGPAANVLGATSGDDPLTGEPSPRPPTPAARLAPAREASGYPGQIVLADLVGGLVVGGALSVATKSAVPVLLTWSLASPAVHVVQDHPWRGAVSLLLHVGLPVLGGLAANATKSCPERSTGDGVEPFCGVPELVVLVALGMVTATLIDAAVLGQMREESPRAGGPASAPTLTVGRNGELDVGWRGTF